MLEYFKNLKQRDIAIGVIVLVILVSVAWWFLLYQPTQEGIDKAKNEIARLDDDILRGQQAKDSLPVLRAAVDELQRAKNEFLQELPRTNEIANLLNQLTESAKSDKVVINDLSQATSNSRQQDIQDVRQLDFSVDTEGVYTATLDFLRSLEQLSNGRFTKVNTVDFSVGDGTDDKENFPEQIRDSVTPTNPPLSTNYSFSVFVYTGDDVESGGN